jgi:hypothetical protein
MRNSLILATFAVLGALAAGSSIGCDSGQAAFDCQQACERYSSNDVGGCEDRCSTNAANEPNVQATTADLRMVDPKIRRQIRFEVPFDHIPDFLTVDQDGRTEDSFQYDVAYDPTQQADSGTVQGAIVRGDEIHVAGALRIRNALPASPDPTSGGWGTVRATVPFEMRFNRDGSAVLSFVASCSDLGISGPFSWVLDTFHFGAAVGSLRGVFSAL